MSPSADPEYVLPQRNEFRALLLLEVALLPDEGGDAELAVRVLDPDGRRIDGAALELDGRAVGDTSTAGTIRLAGLETGPADWWSRRRTWQW